MVINVLLKSMSEVVNGVSNSTGNAYQSQDILVEWSEPMSDGRERISRLMVRLHTAEVDRLAAMNPVPGQTTLGLDLLFSTRSYNGRVYNDVTARLA